MHFVVMGQPQLGVAVIETAAVMISSVKYARIASFFQSRVMNPPKVSRGISFLGMLGAEETCMTVQLFPSQPSTAGRQDKRGDQDTGSAYQRRRENKGFCL